MTPKNANNGTQVVVLTGLVVVAVTVIAVAVLFFTDSSSQASPMLEAQQAFIAGDYARAVSYFSDVLHEDADNYTALVGRGIAYFRLDDLTTAQRDLQAAAALPEGELDTRAVYYLGEIAHQEGRLSDAVDYYSEVIAIAEAQGNMADGAAYRRGQIFAQQGDYSSALREYERAIEANATNADYFRAQGDAFFALGNEQQALNSYQVYVSLSPDGGDFEVQMRLDALRDE